MKKGYSRSKIITLNIQLAARDLMAKPYEKSLIIALSGLLLLAGVGVGRNSHAQRVIPLPPPPPII
jgi:hypothetical protein